MDKLMEHTIQRQLVEQSTQISNLTTLVQQLVINAAPAGSTTVTTNTTNNTNNTNTINVINIRPWDGERRIDVTTAQIAAAFAENARLKEYVRLEEHQLTDPEIAPPYVTELLMDLTKRAHADPIARNVYLNPRRADQALVHMTNGQWEVMPLAEATRLIFDGVAKAMVRVTMSNEERKRLPMEAQNALAMAGLLYDDEPDEYAKRAKAPMVAHLANCRDASPQINQ